MLEVDEDSRLGREVIAGGTRYHAHFVPDDDATADYYLQAGEMLEANGMAQYEISNFAAVAARFPHAQSRHNLKYWTRQPYLGFGVDAHSMLPVSYGHLGFAKDAITALRFARPDSLEAYMNRVPHEVTPISVKAALEESFFLGLRLNRGVDLQRIQREFDRWQGNDRPGKDDLQTNRKERDFHRATDSKINPAFSLKGSTWEAAIKQCQQDELMEQAGTTLRLTARGRLLSNEVFARFLAERKEKAETGRAQTRSLLL